MGTARTLGLASIAALVMGLSGGALEAGAGADLEWPQRGGGPTHDNFRPVANAVTWPKVRWRVAAARGQPTIGGGFLFAGGDRLVKLDPATGRVVASHAVGTAPAVRVADAPVLTASSVIARSTDGRVFAIDRDLKDVAWTWQGPAFSDMRWSGVLADDGPYVLAAGGEVVALAPTSGEVLWRTKLEDGEGVSTTPAAHGGRVFLGTERGRFLALDLATGRPVWTKTGGSKYVVTSPTVAFGRVYVGDRGIPDERAGAVHAFDEATGDLLWSTVFHATGFSTPGVVPDPAGGGKIVAGFGRSVALFDARTGERAVTPAIATGPNAFGSPTVVGDTIYFGNLDGHLYAHDLATGALRWSFELPLAPDGSRRHQVGDFTYAHDRVYVSTELGLFAIGQDPERGTAPAGFVLRWVDPDASAAPPPATNVGPVAPPRPSPTGATPAAIAAAWTRDAMQLRDAALRASTLAAVRASLAGPDAVAAHAALLTLARIGQVAYDKAAMRPLVLARLAASEGPVRVAAAYALFNTAWEPQDLDLVLAIADDPSPDARRAASHLVTMFAKGRLDGAAGAAVARLLEGKDTDLVREALRGLWGATVSADVEDRVLALARAPETRHDAIYFGLSTFEGKSARVVDALIDALGDPDVVNVAGRALWGLAHGVPPEHQAHAADGLLLLLEARDDARTQREVLRALSQYGSETHAQALDALAANAQANAEVRLAAADAAKAIRGRAPRVRATPGADSGSASQDQPAAITQVWPQHRNGEALPIADARDTDPNCPTGGRMWRWQVVPPRPAVGPTAPPLPRTDDAERRRVCRLQLLSTRKAGDAWVDDPSMHLAGELMTSQQTQDGRDVWASDAARGVWWTTDGARPLPASGFTFGVAVTKKEMAKAEIRRVRFTLARGGDAGALPPGPSAALASIDVWTDPFGAPRAVPLTAPVTPVGLVPRTDGVTVGPAGLGLRGLLVVRGARAVVDVRDATAAGQPLVVYASLERDLDGDDPSPSGLRATRAAVPESRHVRITATTSALDAAGQGSFAIEAPDEPQVVGLAFYVQAGVGPDAASGLSCALACTVVASLTDYDGDGRPNAQDAAPLDPAR